MPPSGPGEPVRRHASADEGCLDRAWREGKPAGRSCRAFNWTCTTTWPNESSYYSTSIGYATRRALGNAECRAHVSRYARRGAITLRIRARDHVPNAAAPGGGAEFFEAGIDQQVLDIDEWQAAVVFRPTVVGGPILQPAIHPLVGPHVCRHGSRSSRQRLRLLAPLDARPFDDRPACARSRTRHGLS